MDRIEELIQRTLAQIIQQTVKEPGLQGMVTLSAVKVSKDLGFAKIYFTVIKQDPEETAIILNTAAGHLRSLLAKQIRLRKTPQLHFYYDESVEYSSNLSRLIDKLNPNDSSEDEETK